MNIQEENEKLVKANATLVETINVSKLALEASKKQEEEGLSVLLELSKKVEAMSASTEVTKKELHKTNFELEALLAEKTKVELAISTAQKEAKESYLEEQTKYEAKFQALRGDIQVKQNELAELVSKVRAEIFNLNTVKGEISLLNVELIKSKSRFNDLENACSAKESELGVLTSDIEVDTTKLAKALQVLKDTEVSTEAYEDRKTTLRAELVVLEEKIEAERAVSVDIKTEIAKLEADKAIKEAEYKASEAKVFDLIEREENLNEREVYARERFKTAGLEY